MKWLRWVGLGVLALLGASAAAYWWLFVESHRAPPGLFSIDLAEVRRLADAQPGEKPLVIRVETVAHLAAPKVFVVAGDSWRRLDLPVSSYELIYRDRTAVIDTALNADIGRAMGTTAFAADAYERMSGALSRASLIVVTHEHPDHVGGLLAQLDLRRLLSVARLTHEQVAEIKTGLKSGSFAGLHLPPDTFSRYQPLNYTRYLAIAPGVVLIKAPGHTPGSQMVYVRRADGVEILFLGDVAWQMRNVEMVREKARFITWQAIEDRAKVREELAGLNQLHLAHPEIHLMPGHDAAVIRAFIASKLLAAGF